MSSSPQNPTMVLVHGAWADGSSWKEVILRLERKDFKVICASVPLTSLTDDISALNRTLERTTGPLVVAGHAYAGAVIGAIREDRVKAFVYVAALAPDVGETVAQVFYRDEPHPQAPKLTTDKHGFIWMPEDGFRNAFAQHATAEQIAVSAAVQRPIALKSIQEPVPMPAWRSKPSWYLIAEEDRMINPKTQRFMAERMGAKPRSSAVDHTPLLSAPDKVVDILIEAAGNVGWSEKLSFRHSSI